MIKRKPGVLLENHIKIILHLELFRPERKRRYVKDDTAISRPDNRYPGRVRDGADERTL